jgi:hypothetical protein
MRDHPRQSLDERIADIAGRCLAHGPTVSPLDVLIGLQWLHPGHLKQWERQLTACLEPTMQSTREKRHRVLELFTAWAAEQGLEPFDAEYWPATRDRARQLQITPDNDPALEALYRRHYARPGLAPKRREQIIEKARKAPDLIVYQGLHLAVCAECQCAIQKGDFLVLEQGEPRCLNCADLDHLTFLPSGDATLSRRARQHSPLNAIVVRTARGRHRYERQGILVQPEALARAEAECLADADARARQRERDAGRRAREDVALCDAMAATLRRLFPGAPADELAQVARHTSERGSGRVGRSAAGRELDEQALRLAVIAHLRHCHTDYDLKLMQGVSRDAARAHIRAPLEARLRAWEAAP